MSSYLDIHKTRLDFILNEIKKLNLKKGSTILDIGCFPLYIFETLSSTYNTHGISSPHEPIRKKNITTADIESEKLNHKDNSIDLIICTEVIEHLVNPKNIIQESFRILKPGGHLLITTPNATRLQNIVRLIYGHNIYFPLSQLLETNPSNINHRHNREYTLSELHTILKDFGFRIEKHFAFTAYTANRPRKANFIKKFLALANQLATQLLKSRSDTLFLLAQKPSNATLDI